jgi:hypothetical protein
MLKKNLLNNMGKGIANAIKGTGYFSLLRLDKKLGKAVMEIKYHLILIILGVLSIIKNLKGVVGFVVADTTEYVNGKKVNMKQKFSKFATVEDGIAGYVNVLKAPRYAKALQAKTPYEQLLEIAKAGYSTNDPKAYANSIYPLVEAARDISQIGRVV